jgi:hypothetical protein
MYLEAEKIGKPSKSPRLNRIQQLIEKSAGLAVLTYADLDHKSIPTGEEDSTVDIPSMKRSDNIWSQCVAYAIARTLAILLRYSFVFRTADVFYDAKSLKEPHRDVLKKTLQERLKKHTHHSARRYNLNLGETAKVRRVQEVQKATNTQNANKFQIGIDISHRLCGLADQIIGNNPMKRICVYDHTNLVMETISAWQ